MDTVRAVRGWGWGVVVEGVVGLLLSWAYFAVHRKKCKVYHIRYARGDNELCTAKLVLAAVGVYILYLLPSTMLSRP